MKSKRSLMYEKGSRKVTHSLPPSDVWYAAWECLVQFLRAGDQYVTETQTNRKVDTHLSLKREREREKERERERERERKKERERVGQCVSGCGSCVPRLPCSAG